MQFVRHDYYAKKARNRYTTGKSVSSPSRGNIYDRTGEKLAINKHSYSIGYNPAQSKAGVNLKRNLSNNLNIGYKKISRFFSSRNSFFWLARKVSPYKIEQLDDYTSSGLVIEKENSRFYPRAPLASSVIGWVGMDNQGLSGIEFNFNRQLKQKKSDSKVLVDAARRRIIRNKEKAAYKPAEITLTLDTNLQYIVHRELKKGFKKYDPKWAMGIIQDPHTGEILAMATYPGGDNNRGVSKDNSKLKNKAVSNIFEPGSTFKIVTAAAALEEDLVEPDEVIDCEGGKYEVGGFPIRDFNPYDELTFKECMLYSSNIGLAKIGDRLGEKLLYKYGRDFGFGNFTGIRLPGEVRGILRKPDRWSGTSVSRISFGQEVGVTAIQLVGAFSTIANGGILYEPRIVKEVVSEKNSRNYEIMPVRRVISSGVAEKMKEILYQVVENGSGSQGKVPGYKTAGKTGTAQKSEPGTGNYAEDKYVALFGGFVPVDDPKYTILVIFDEPAGRLHWGGYVAAPVFSKIARSALSYSNVIGENYMVRKK
ncbi:MAG: peptidoglycan D,D-transpeptidase FtsI family protein [Elusimicrobiota bacterium]